MNYVILFLFIIIMAYIVFKNREFDYFMVLAFSTVIYYFPAMLGKIRLSENLNMVTDIEPMVYVCIGIFTTTLFVFIILKDKYTFKIGSKKLFYGNEVKIKMYEDYSANLAVLVLELIGILLLIYTFFLYGNFSVDFNKMELLSEGNRFTEYLKYISLFSFVYAFINKGHCIILIRLLSILLIGYTFLLGHRSFMVLGLIGVLLFRLRNGKKIRLFSFIKKHKMIVILVFMGACFFMFVKGVFAAFMAGNYDLVKSRLTSSDYYLNTLLTSESNSITSNLHRVCANNMKYSIINYIVGFIQLIPVLGNSIVIRTGYVSFESALNIRFNSQLDEGVGLASTFLGESYSIGGIATIVIISIFVFIIILWMQKKLYCTRNCLVATFLSVILPYFAFYIHRNSLIYLFIMMRAYLYILMFTLVLRWMMKSLLFKSTNKRGV